MADTSPAAPFLAFAHALADAAGHVIQPYFRKGLAVERKADSSPVTIADREAERRLRAMIAAAYPDHGIEGEEHGKERTDAEFVWCLDPIDGTKSFITGRPLFGTLISLLHRGRPILGVIDQCVLRERWVGLAGAASTWNGEPIAVRACPSLADAVLYATSPQLFKTPAGKAAFARVERAVQLPMYGGDCYAYGLLALGFVDVIVEAGLSTYDFMALIPVIEGAGGLITDWQGRPLSVRSDGCVVAAGDPRVHADALALLAAGAE